MRVFNGVKVPVKSWCNEPEGGAVEQAIQLSGLPFVFKQVCLMPDTHQGYGVPIGGVIACKNVVIPNAVGVDIGCGMSALRLNIDNQLTVDDLKSILCKIRKTVPVGFTHHEYPREWEGFDRAPELPVIAQQLKAAKKQLGTLGGGNHFIEIQRGNDGYLWAMVHSGSRNFGLKIAKYYNELATTLCERWYSSIPQIKGQDGLAFLPIDDKEAQNYIVCMNYALEFAFENRKQMMSAVLAAIIEVTGCSSSAEEYNIHHNYASLENHFGENVWVHRKGATSAKIGEIGIIPGSQGTKSYIVKGKGNPESFHSCSHGAGRKLSRRKAREELNLDQEREKMDQAGILHALRYQSDLDEAASAYKDISVVMEEQSDLVQPVVELQPLAVIKG